MLLHRAAGLLACLSLAACATLPEPAGGDQNLPSANAGPFRALSKSTQLAGDAGVGDELSYNCLTAPYGFEDGVHYGRDIAVLDADGDPTTLEVIAYVAAAANGGGETDPTVSIMRYEALDGRSFVSSADPLAGAGEVVLQASAPWEGGVMGGPAALRSGGKFLLYYAAAGGIGLARSDDGHAFTKVPGPVLGPATSGWDGGVSPASPGVVQLADGSFRMFYEVAIGGGATAIGEASSPDGVAWTRVGDGPALAPSGGGDAGPSPWDAASVGSPFPLLVSSAAGRTVLRVYYGALDVAGMGTIGLAARYGTDGPLERATEPVFGASSILGPREPCVVEFAELSFLYVTEASGMAFGIPLRSPAVAVGVAPATAVLPPPVPVLCP